MRRMITEKQQEAIKQIKVDPNKVDISGTGELYLNSMEEDPYAQIVVNENPGIYLNIYNDDTEEMETKIQIGEDNIVVLGVAIFAGTIDNTIELTNNNDDFHLSIPHVSYIMVGGDLKAEGSSGNVIMLYGARFLTSAEITTLNTVKPTIMSIDAVKIGENPDVYGIINTKIIIGPNVYVWDSRDEEAYVLQGTYQDIVGQTQLRFLPFEISAPIQCYNM